jgi:hypothetical protein
MTITSSQSRSSIGSIRTPIMLSPSRNHSQDESHVLPPRLPFGIPARCIYKGMLHGQQGPSHRVIGVPDIMKTFTDAVTVLINKRKQPAPSPVAFADTTLCIHVCQLEVALPRSTTLRPPRELVVINSDVPWPTFKS